MKRYITVILCLLMALLVAAQTNVCFSAEPINVKLSFTVPAEGQKVKAGQTLVCKGKFQCSPRNTKLNQIHIWLFLMDREGTMNRYLIQKPVSLKKGGVWEGAVKLPKGTRSVVAVLADPDTEKLFKTWLAKKATVGKQYELPRGARILATVGIKMNNKSSQVLDQRSK